MSYADLEAATQRRNTLRSVTRKGIVHDVVRAARLHSSAAPDHDSPLHERPAAEEARGPRRLGLRGPRGVSPGRRARLGGHVAQPPRPEPRARRRGRRPRRASIFCTNASRSRRRRGVAGRGVARMYTWCTYTRRRRRRVSGPSRAAPNHKTRTQALDLVSWTSGDAADEKTVKKFVGDATRPRGRNRVGRFAETAARIVL